MKRLVFCFDGTWNRLDAQFPTNVVFTAESVVPIAPDGTVQLIHYDEGVGTEKFEKASGGIFGTGMGRNLAEAYRFLVFNYTAGDQIFVFGFSRGAYTARSFCGLLATVGIIRRREAARIGDAVSLYKARKPGDAGHIADTMAFRSKFSPDVCVSAEEDAWRCANIQHYVAGTAPLVRIAYLGVWDTVGSLGIPDRYKFLSWIDKEHEFHDTDLSPFVESARHAVALDERRKDFAPTLWTNTDELNRAKGEEPDNPTAPYQQKWFPGDHGSVGGGGYHRGLSDQALEWILDGARAQGLKLDSAEHSRIYELRPDFREHLVNMEAVPPEVPMKKKGVMSHLIGMLPMSDRENGPTRLYQIDISAVRRWVSDKSVLKGGREYRPASLAGAQEVLAAVKLHDVGLGFETKAEPGRFDLYEVQPNDTLGKIAQKILGAASKAEVIFNANRHQLYDINRIYVGQNLRIPRQLEPAES
jgi:uncharacterized protein (DUF2235 family)